jgi:hypothetical protein
MRAACCAILHWFTVPHIIQSENIKSQVTFSSRAHRKLFITSVPLRQKSATGVIIVTAISGLLRIILHSDRFETAANAAITAIPICRESQYKCSSPVYCT